MHGKEVFLQRFFLRSKAKTENARQANSLSLSGMNMSIGRSPCENTRFSVLRRKKYSRWPWLGWLGLKKQK